MQIVGIRQIRLAAITAVIAIVLSGALPLVSRQLSGVSAAAASQKASTNTLQLQLAPTVKLQGKTFSGTPADQVAQLNSILNAAGKTQIKKLQAKPDTSALQAKISTKLAGYYVVTAKQGDMTALAAKLKVLSIVTNAYAAPLAAPSPSADYTGLQTYLQASPQGIDTGFAQTIPGGTAGNSHIFDIEYSWDTTHEDLSKARTALLANGTPVDPYSNNNHGTAVLGELIADSNGYGVTGASKDAGLTLINAYNAENGYDPIGALHLAASHAQPGDVVLIEQQTYGPTGLYVPIEWISSVYDTIAALTASGVVVVEPAANGGDDLDSATYGTSFPAGKPDSGAIIVGAGENCNGTSRLARVSTSNYGARVNMQGPGNCVTTTGYGNFAGTTADNFYTNSFNSTSSASPLVAAAAAIVGSANKAVKGTVLTPAQIRSTLQSTGTPQNISTGQLTGNIGPQPNLAKALAPLVTQPAPDTKAPSVPTGLKATAMLSGTTRTVNLSWNASTDNVGVVGYRLYRNGSLYKQLTVRTYTDTSVKAHTTYKYRVAAVDAAGNISARSTVVSATTK